MKGSATRGRTDRGPTMPATDPVQAVADVMRTHLWSHAARSCSCGWERKGKAPFLRQWTKHMAEVVMAAARPAIAAEVLHAMADDLAALTRGKNSEALAEWQNTLRSAYELAIEEAESAIRARAADLEAGR